MGQAQVTMRRQADNRRCVVQHIVECADGMSLIAASRRHDVAAQPDESAARRACGMARRVVRVEFIDGTSPSARVTAIWHRLPHVRAISLGGALALAVSGVPTFLVNGNGR